MKKLTFILCALVIALGTSIRAYGWTDMAYRGELNGWGTTALTYENGIWRGSVEYTAGSGSADLFKLYASDGGTWFGNGQSWSHPDATTVATSGSDMDLNGLNGNYYTFTAIDASSLAMAVQETANTPVSISGFSSEVGNGGQFDPTDNYVSSSIANNVNTVSITLNTAPSAGENVYIAYSTDNFASAPEIVTASGAGTSWSANIPSQNDGTTVHYYVLTSTFSEGNLDSVGANIDVLLRALDENSASAQSYSIYDLGDSFHIPTQTAGSAGEDMLAGNAGAGDQWEGTENEARIYSGNVFQSVGEAADQSSYTLWYKIGAGPWLSQGGVFNNTSGNDKYWSSALDLTGVSSGSVVSYYFQLGYTDSDTTYVYSDGLGGSRISGADTLAPNNAFTFQYGETPAGGGGPDAVPEPNTMSMAVLAGSLILSWRHRIKMQRKARGNS